ncbi:MAG: 7-cyano-7-deazaguanine synthase [Thermomicrobiales bacterium]
MGTEQRPAVVLLSGGLDSTTTLAIARSQGFEVYALSFRYGQRHEAELAAAARIAAASNVAEHVIVQFDLGRFGGSALTADIAVPKGRSLDEMGVGIPDHVPRGTRSSPGASLGRDAGASDIFYWCECARLLRLS